LRSQRSIEVESLVEVKVESLVAIVYCHWQGFMG